MVKKNKQKYKNFNICQLIDKGKIKLQYSDEFKNSKDEYSKVDKSNNSNCRIKNGVVKNINKKIFGGVLVLTLLSTTLTGCSDVSIYDIKYTSENKIDIVNYETLEYCSFYTVYNNKTDEKYYTIGLQDEFNGTYLVKYYDIFTGEELHPRDYTIHSVEEVCDYLEDKDLVKETYLEEDLKKILNEFVGNQEKNKQLVKGK